MNKNDLGLGNLAANPLNEIMKFLDGDDIAKLSGANKGLNQKIKNNPFAQKKISNAKLIVEKIYDVVHEIASSEYDKSFWCNGDGRGPNGEYYFSSEKFNNSLGRCLKNLGGPGCRDKTPMITMLEQWMFLEVLSMDKNLFSSDKPFEQVIEDYLTQPKVQERRKEFLEQSYKIDGEYTLWISVFRNFNKIYFDQLSKTKKWDKKTKNTITSEFIKFWLYQGSKNTDLVNDRKNDKYHAANFSEACKELKRSFFDAKRSFSIDFKGFIDQLTTQELNEYLFANKYYFVDHFKNEIMNNIKFICEQVLSKNKNLPDFSEENVSNKFKKLLGYLAVNSELIDELTLALSKEKITLSEKTNVIEPLEQDNNSEVGLIQQILSAIIKKFFGFDDKKAAVTVTIEKNDNNDTQDFFSKPKAKNLEAGELFVPYAKLTVEKIYDIVHEIASSEYEKSFWRNGDGRYDIPDEIWKYSVGRHLKILGGDRDKTPMVTMLEQWMFLEVLSMDKNLFSGDKPDDQVIKDYLTQSKIQNRREEFLEKDHVINKMGFNRINVFSNFNKIYFDQLSKTKKWDKKTKDTITSKFIKFWLYQGSKIKDLEKNRNVEEYNRPTFSNACKKLKQSFFDSKRTFSIDFKEFISQLTAKELNEYLFDNKYYFVDHFKNEIVNNNNIDFICEQVLSKNKNLPDFNEENITGKFKKLLSNLGVNSKLIDKQMVDLSMQDVNSFNDFVAAPLCNDELNSKTPSYQYNGSEISLVQRVILAIKKFFGFDDREAAPPVTIEKNNNNDTQSFFSKPKAKNLGTSDSVPLFNTFQNEGLVK